MTKHIRLFESYSNEQDRANAIYESVMDNLLSKGISLDFINSRLNEQLEWADEEEELTSGEKAALTRGLDLMTKPQMAAIYLLAKGRSEENTDNHEYIRMIPGINLFGYVDETDRDFRITIPGMADAIGMDSDRTLTYTRDKFQNLINDIGETQSQSLSPKLIRAHDALSKMQLTNIVAIASDAIQDASYTVNRDAADSRRERTNLKASERRDRIQAEDDQIAKTIHDLVNGFKKEKWPIEKYSKIIFSKLKKDYPNIGLSRMYDAYSKYLSGQDVSLYIMKPKVA